MNRFLNSLVRHVCDTRGKVALGFMLFALHVNPLVIKDIIAFEGNGLALSSALVKQGYPAEASTIMAFDPRKFLYPELMKFWKGKTEGVIVECCRILQKMDVLADPGPLMSKFLDCCNQRRLIVELLLTAPSIRLAMPKLLIVLQRLATMGTDTIIACLSEDSVQWEALTQKQASKEDRAEAQLKTESVVEFFQEMTKDLEEVVPLNEIIELSKHMSEEVEGYHHCEYQAAVAAISLSCHDPLIVIVSPTGSGKTWMQGLIALYHCSQRRSVTVIEPNEVLRVQTAEKLGLVHPGIQVTTIDRLYAEGPWGDVTILNEYDTIVNEVPYYLHASGLSGLWKFKGRNVYAFSATSSPSYERLLNNCIGAPRVLKFKSEYEMVHGTSPVQEAIIRQCPDHQSALEMVVEDIAKVYDQKPAVVVHNPGQEAYFIQHCQRQKWKFAQGVSE